MYRPLRLLAFVALAAPASAFFRKIGGRSQRVKLSGRRIGTAAAHAWICVFVVSTVDSPCALLVDSAASGRHRRAIRPIGARLTHTGGGGPPGGFGGGFGGNVFPTPGEETGFFFMLPKKMNSATQNEKTTLKTKKNRKAEKHLKLGLPALKLAIAQNPIKGFFKAFFDFSPAEGSVTYAENTVSTRK